MEMSGIPFGTTDWSTVTRTAHKGESGVAHWRTLQFSDIRVRIPATAPKELASAVIKALAAR